MPSSINIDSDELIRLYKRHAQGESINSISADFGIHYETLSRKFKKNNLPIIKKSDIYWSDRDRICSLYADEKSINDISSICKIPSVAVFRVLKKSNIKLRQDQSCYLHKMRRYDIDAGFFNKIDTPDKAYILGFLYADGNAHSKLAQIKLKLQERDRHILEEINEKIGHSKPLHFHSADLISHQNQLSIVITCKEIYNDLIRHGVIPNKTFKVVYPSWLQDKLISHFIRGYFDGDGCFYIDYKRKVAEWSLIGTTEFCLELQKILMNLFNIRSSIQHDVRCKVGIDRLRVRKKRDILTISAWLYNDTDFFLKRKKNKYLEFKEMVL